MTTAERQLWLAERRTGIGGSDAAAACGMSKWRTRLDLYLDKTGMVESNETPAMRWGQLLEPIVRQEYAETTGQSVSVPGWIVRHSSIPWMIYTPDGVTADGRLYEGKTSRTAEGWGDPGSGEIPTEYLFQVQHGMLVLDLPVADVAVLVGGSDFRVYTVEADAELQRLIVDAEAEFWGMVERREPPEPETPEDIRRRWSISSGRKVEASAEIAAMVAELAAVRSRIKEQESQAENLAATIQAYMRDASELVAGNDTLVTWRQSKPAKRFDAKAFERQHPELHAQFVREASPSRRFLLKGCE